MKNSKLMKAAYSVVAFTTTTLPVFAQESGILNPNDRAAVVSQTNLRQGLVNIVNYVLGFLGLIAVGYIIYAGINMVTSGGEQEKVKKGTKTITYAIAGLLVIFLSYAIVNWVVFAPSNTPGQ